MEKLIEKYKKECDIVPNTSNNIWKIGIIVFLIIFLLEYIFIKKYILIYIGLFIKILILYLVCEIINAKSMKKALKINGKCTIKKIHDELDKFQKGWITNYCKKNKLNKIEKINILRDELKSIQRETNRRYINPIIIATLSLNIWDIIIKNIDEGFGMVNTIVISLILAIIISLIIEIGKKEYKEQLKFFNTFKEMKGYKRLDSLLVYIAMKCNK